MNCEICNVKINKKLINLGLQPIPDNLSSNKKKSITKKKYQTKVLFCPKCLTAQQRYTVRKKDLYKKNYSYRAKNTKDVVIGLKNLSNQIKKNINLKHRCKVLDIGCNDGTFLNFFNKKKFLTYGIEPTGAAKDCSQKHKIYNNFFDISVAKKFLKENGKPDVIVFTNVFAHIENLSQILEALNILIGNKTLLVIENHYLISVLKKFQFDTFYHEHIRTYSLNSFYHIGNFLNIKIIHVSFPKRYGGNIRVFFRRNDKKKINIKQKIYSEKKKFFKLKKIFSNNFEKWKKNKKIEIQLLNKKYGPLPAKSFPARASVVINYLNLNRRNIYFIFEQNFSKKVNKYVPGTDIKIISDDKLKKIKKNIPIINFSWHISNEIRSYLKKKGLKNKIIDIINKKDFI